MRLYVWSIFDGDYRAQAMANDEAQARALLIQEINEDPSLGHPGLRHYRDQMIEQVEKVSPDVEDGPYAEVMYMRGAE